MARDYAVIRNDIWNDDHWRKLTTRAQHLYLQLLTSSTLNYAGVADWRSARLAALSSDATRATVEDSADELARELFIVIDEETEEVLVRSFLKHDGLLHKPNVTKAMVSAFADVASARLRGVIVHELTRLHAKHPEWNGFSTGTGVLELLERDSVDPSGTVPEEVGKGQAKGSTKGSETDPSLLTPNSLLLAPDSTRLTPSPNEVRDDVMSLCNLLADLIEQNGSLRPTIGKTWTDAARLLLDKDGRDVEAAARLMLWTQANTFWKANVLSLPKFRDKYDQLRLAANRQLETKQQGSRGNQRDAELVAFMTGADDNYTQEIER